MIPELTAVVIRVPERSAIPLGRTFGLVEHQTLIGRAPDTDLCLDDLTVSRRHARLTIQEGSVSFEALSETNGTFLNGQRLAPGTPGVARIADHGLHLLQPALDPDSDPVDHTEDGTVHLQVGGILLQLRRAAATRPIHEPLSAPIVPKAAQRPAPLLSLQRDGDGCTVSCRGRYVEVPAAAARVLWELARNASGIVHLWELQDAAGADANIPQLVSQIRRAFRQLVEDGFLDRKTLRRNIHAAASGARLSELDALEDEALMRRLILSRRNHGYVLCLPPDAVHLATI